MGETKNRVELSKKHLDETEATKKALQKVSEKLIADTKQKTAISLFRIKTAT